MAKTKAELVAQNERLAMELNIANNKVAELESEIKSLRILIQRLENPDSFGWMSMDEASQKIAEFDEKTSFRFDTKISGGSRGWKPMYFDHYNGVWEVIN